MPRELRPLVRRLSLRPAVVDGLAGSPTWQGGGVAAVVVGVGPLVAARAAARILDTLEPERVLIAGVAGAAVPALGVGEVLVPEAVVDARTGRVHQPFGWPDPGTRRGILATVDHLGAPVPDGAWAVDMETAAVAAACESRGVPWDVRRAISDVPGTLRPAFGSLLRPDGRADGWAAARLLARHPAELTRLVRLGWDTRRAVAAMTAAAAALLDGVGQG